MLSPSLSLSSVHHITTIRIHRYVCVTTQIQLARQHEAAALSNTKLEERLSLASVNLHSLEARLRDIEDAKQTSTEKYTELTRKCLSLEDELAQARQRVADLTAESQIERARTDTLQGDLAALRDKYSALKRRMAEAGRKVGNGIREPRGIRAAAPEVWTRTLVVVEPGVR